MEEERLSPESLKEESLKTLDRINFWISNCDTKISFSLAFAGILLGGFFSSGIITGSLSKLIDKLTAIDSLTHHWEMRLVELTSLVLLAFILLMVVTITYLFRGIKGTIDPDVYKQSKLTTDSKLFFGTIQNQQFDAFQEKALNLKPSDVLNDTLSQVYINSKICQRKFNLYNKGVNYLILSTIVFVVLNILFLFI